MNKFIAYKTLFYTGHHNQEARSHDRSILSWCVGERMEGIVVLISAIIDFFFQSFSVYSCSCSRFLTRFGIRDQEQSDSHVHLFPFLLSINGCLLSCSTRAFTVLVLNMVGGAIHSMLWVNLNTAESVWDNSISSSIKPKLDIGLFVD